MIMALLSQEIVTVIMGVGSSYLSEVENEEQEHASLRKKP